MTQSGSRQDRRASSTSTSAIGASAAAPRANGPSDQHQSTEASVAQRLAELRQWETQLTALHDARPGVDDPDRFVQTWTLIEAGQLLARHRLEHTPPEDGAGVTLLLRYVLSMTDDPSVAAVIKSCLITLLGIEASLKIPDAAEIPDEAFDAATNWPYPTDGRIRASTYST